MKNPYQSGFDAPICVFKMYTIITECFDDCVLKEMIARFTFVYRWESQSN